MVPVEQRLEFFLTFSFADLLGITFFEVFRRYFKEPLGVNCTNFAHVLFCRLYQLVVDHPLGTFVEQGGRWVNENLLVVTYRLIAFSWVLTTAMVEEAGTDSLANLGVVF